MNNVNIKEFVNSIFASKTYILYQNNHDKVWIVDIGDTEPVIDFLIEKDLSVSGVFFTHSHFDHIYGINDFLKKFPDCIIYTSEYGKIALKDAKKNLSFYHEQPIEYSEDNVQVLKEGDKIELFPNIYLEVLETPGHCPSCLTYYTDDYIFTGDSYIPNEKPVTKLKGGNKEDYQNSLQKILGIIDSDTIVCPGHGKIITSK